MLEAYLSQGGLELCKVHFSSLSIQAKIRQAKSNLSLAQTELYWVDSERP